MRRLLLIVLFLAAWATWHATPSAQTPTLIVMSFDGFRWDYPTKAPTPNMRALIARGVKADNLIPSFPSKTFPNHYTIVTGLYPGHHGIVANTIRDPETGRTFRNSDSKEVRDPMWWGGEPIWVTAERAGKPAGSIFWPGSEAFIKGIRPHFWKAYDEHYPANSRIDEALGWLDLPSEQRPALITLYFEDTDTAGHADGPDSAAVKDAIVRDDGYLGRLVRGLEQRRILDRVNIVVVSDHGMAAVNTRDVVVVDDYLSQDDAEIVDINPTLAVFPKPGKIDAVFRALVNAHPHLKVYRREETPEHWHYRDHPRVPPIMGVADEGWQVVRRTTADAVRAGTIRGGGGMHGYDPRIMSMRGIFVAAGPAFKQGTTVPAFENIHIYNALAQALGVTPAPNDGDPAIARRLLR